MQRQMLDLLEICTPISFPTPDTLELKIPDAHKVSAQSLLPDGPRYIGLAPGSGGRPKCWPLDSYINVAKKIEADGGVPVFFIGPQEQEWADVISKQFPLTSLPLQQGEGPEHHHFDPLFTIALAQRLAASVSNDSGVAHMFAVSGVPLVALYGPTVYEKFPPMAKNIQVIRAENYGSRDMSSIPENAVIAALDQLLKSHGA